MESATQWPVVWLWIGFAGQGLFFCRFLVQWIVSERLKRSVVPNAFWFFSIGGGMVLLAYAIHRRDPVFIVGQATGLLIYSRNLWFIYRRGELAGTAEATPAVTAPGARPPLRSPHE
ncbi:MAG TPA: lipid-A-disaccharide synthase N-terminal domain-containing protein [Thermoanaerobaculia bacterium]|nr:lipid-A-disaccharide synthase N-terminal domain-containing protein [Thermoanaerobaculia bacterium]